MHKLIIAAAAIIILGGVLLILHFLGTDTGRTNHYTRSRKKKTQKESPLEMQVKTDSSVLKNENNAKIETLNIIIDPSVDETWEDIRNDSDSILGIKKPPLSVQNKVVTQNKGAEQTESNEQNANTRKLSSRIIIVHLMAPKDRPYSGYELLQSLLANGLRFGKMNIFHRHEQKTGRGSILFSLASAQKPGTFDLPKMGGFSCPGLTLFLSINRVEDPLKAFDVMLETVGQLLDDLGGRVLDEQFEPLTKEKVVMVRKKIREILENEPTPDLFEEINQ